MTTYHSATAAATATLRAHVAALVQEHGGQAFPVLAALRAVTDELYAQHRNPVQDIVNAVAAAHGLPPREMVTQCRTPLLLNARHHAAWEIRNRRPDVPLVKIAAWLNRMDHTTVINGIKRFQLAVDAGRYEKERAHVERALK